MINSAYLLCSNTWVQFMTALSFIHNCKSKQRPPRNSQAKLRSAGFQHPTMESTYATPAPHHRHCTTKTTQKPQPLNRSVGLLGKNKTDNTRLFRHLFREPKPVKLFTDQPFLNPVFAGLRVKFNFKNLIHIFFRFIIFFRIFNTDFSYFLRNK